MLNNLTSLLVASMCALIVFFLTTGTVAAWTQRKFEIYLFDVGQADSQLILSPSGKE